MNTDIVGAELVGAPNRRNPANAIFLNNHAARFTTATPPDVAFGNCYRVNRMDGMNKRVDLSLLTVDGVLRRRNIKTPIMYAGATNMDSQSFKVGESTRVFLVNGYECAGVIESVSPQENKLVLTKDSGLKVEVPLSSIQATSPETATQTSEWVLLNDVDAAAAREDASFAKDEPGIQTVSPKLSSGLRIPDPGPIDPVLLIGDWNK